MELDTKANSLTAATLVRLYDILLDEENNLGIVRVLIYMLTEESSQRILTKSP